MSRVRAIGASAAHFITRLVEDRRGVSAIEFALIAPLMILIYFGLTQICQIYMAERRTGHTAAMVADLVAQTETTKKVELERVFAIGQLIMRPFPQAPLNVRVTSVTVDANKVARVDWSHNRGAGLPPLTKKAVYSDLPAGLVDPGESLIVGETRYTYPSGLAKMMPKDIVLSRKYYLRPRTVNQVTCSDC
jgi:Flp pilus assembly protein TadG